MKNITYDLIEKYESLKDAEAADEKILKETSDSLYYYALSPDRVNVIESFPFTKDMKVLQLGGQSGIFTPLSGRVSCWDITDPEEEELALVKARFPEKVLREYHM